MKWPAKFANTAPAQSLGINRGYFFCDSIAGEEPRCVWPFSMAPKTMLGNDVEHCDEFVEFYRAGITALSINRR